MLPSMAAILIGFFAILIGVMMRTLIRDLSFQLIVPIIFADTIFWSLLIDIFNIPDNYQVYLLILIVATSVILPVLYSIFNFFSSARIKRKFLDRLRTLRNNPNLSEEQKRQIDNIIDSNPYN